VTAWVVAGPAGSGKSTLGRALADARGAVLLDLDTATNPLLDAVIADATWGAGHWNEPQHREVVRPARYAVLRALAADQVLDELVLVAPFTAELGGGPEWEALVLSVSPRPVRVVWLDATPELLRDRLAMRADSRDRHALPAGQPPAVPHLRVDAAAPTDDQLESVLSRA
jgi:mannitol-1-/sugar-/sorbitol-6-phosphatase